MPSGSDFQDSIDKTREAFRRTSGEPPSEGPLWPESRPREIPREPEVARGLVAPDRELHPFFRGLLETLPEPGAGWAPAKREQWLETARNIFALIYRDPAEEPALLRPVERESSGAPPEPRTEQYSA